MAQQGGYLSTDPNAGTPLPQDYLSTDPNAGEPPPAATGGNVLPSTRGFLGNVLTSGVQFGKDIFDFGKLGAGVMGSATGITPESLPIAQHVMELAKQPTQTGRSILDALKQRYGSYEAFLNSAYKDPVGVASDLSIVFGGVAEVAKLGQATKAMKAIGGLSEALNPLAIPAKIAETGGQALYTAAVNPSRRINRSFPGAMEEGMRSAALPTEGSMRRVENKLEASAANTQALLQEADAKGAAPVNVKAQVIPALTEPAQKAGTRYRLGGPDERIDVSQRAKELAARNPTGSNLVTSNKVKQQAQLRADSAYRAQERGAQIKDIDAMMDEKVAAAYRKAIETNAANVGVTDIAQSNKQTQALIGLTQALEEATHQPTRLTNLIGAATAGGGAMAGGGPGALAAYGAYRTLTAKPVMAAVGIVGKRGAAPTLRHAQLMRALQFLQTAASEGPAKNE